MIVVLPQRTTYSWKVGAQQMAGIDVGSGNTEEKDK